MERWAGAFYLPSWMEFSITMMIVTFGFIAFYLIAKYFPVFTHEEHQEPRRDLHAGSAWKKDIEEVSRLAEGRV